VEAQKFEHGIQNSTFRKRDGFFSEAMRPHVPGFLK
jgi:hypothetical protein